MHGEPTHALDPGNGRQRRLDPRARVALAAGLTGAVVLVPPTHCLALLPVAALVPAAALAAGVPLRPLAKRMLGFLPALIFLAAWPALFDHQPAQLWTPLGELATTRGWQQAGTLALTALTILSTTWLLAATTPMPELLSALRHLGCPRVLTCQLGFAWRYLHVLRLRAAEYAAARGLRDAGRGSRRRRARAWGNLLAVFFLRTLDEADRVGGAMALRGHGRRAHDLPLPRITPAARLVVAAAACAPLALLAARLWSRI